MTTAEARQLVQKTFQNPFDRGQFVYFIKNLVNEIDDEKAFHARGYIHEKYRDRVKTYERIGTYTDPEENKIDILIVYLQKESSIDRARTTLRNFVGDYLKERGEKEAGLIAFVSPNQKDWRFSLVKMEYKITETPSGRVKAKEEFTPAKRYSFLVGVEETSHTAQSRLVPILEDDKQNPTLKQIEEAFNIEKVTKEFFEKYRDLYLRVKETLDEVLKKDKAIKADFAGKNIDTVDFGKKLLGQIVFLYFLQKKGWFGVKRGEAWGSGSKNFLRELFDKKHGDYKNFFNDILEPLFYEALRNDRSHDDHYFSMFKCKIPFLNGGLFDPINNYDWKETDIILPNDLFSNSYKTKEGDIGTGILDIFDRYNFTVKEDEPLEKEVAVDPEMLGKVFENLLEVKDRKSKGTYYTPREIVHYMCQEGLVNYLATELDKKVSKKDIETLIKYGETVVEHEAEVESRGKETKTYSHKLSETVRDNAKLIDEKLEKIRICDPAVGSGAFPVGMMNEIIRTRNALTSYLKTKKGRTIYDFKRHAIQNCLYGVDIDLGAVEIAKLRLWLSLIVDEEDIKEIKPLPNLDYKIVQGNSLSSVEKSGLFVSHWMQELEKVKGLLFDETNPRKKQEYQKQIDKLINQITNGRKEFDFGIYFSEVFKGKNGFDVVIANPPYVRQENILNKQELLNSMKIAFPTYFAADENKIDAKSDLYTYFYVRGISLLNKAGIKTFICSNSWLDVGYGAWLQKFLLEKAKIDLIIDSSVQRSFESADINTIISFIKALPNNPSPNHLVKFVMFKKPFEEAIALENLQAIENTKDIISNETFRVYPISVAALKEAGMEYENETQEKLKVGKYIGDKWGSKYLRAPDIYFTILRKGGVLTNKNYEAQHERESKTGAARNRSASSPRLHDRSERVLLSGGYHRPVKLVRLGDIAEVRFGIKTGANEFFYLQDKTDTMKFEEIKTGIKNLGQYKTLPQIKAAGLRVVQNDAGDYWLIEEEFLKPIIKSPRECEAILINPQNLKYKLLLCSKTKGELQSTAVLKYIVWGEKEKFDQRASTKGRNRWWNLGSRKPARLNFNYLINDVGDTYIGSVFVSDNFHEIHTDEHLEAFLNSTVFWLFQNLSGRTSFGGGLLKIQTYELERVFVLPSENKKDFPVLKRTPKSVFEECGINPESNIPIEEQEPNPLPDRAELENVVFDALELTENERKDVYRAVCRLVWNRLSKARSV